MLGVARYHTLPLPKGWPRRASDHTLCGLNLAVYAPYNFAGPLHPGPFLSQMALRI
jgi:hypothetical protein